MLKDLLMKYIAKATEANELVQEKALVERKIGLLDIELKDIRRLVYNAKPEGTVTFLVEIEGQQCACQINNRRHYESDEFITFYKLTLFEEIEPIQDTKSLVSTEDIQVARHQPMPYENPEWDELKYEH